MSRLVRRTALGAALIAALASGGCVVTTPVKMAKGVAFSAAKHSSGGILFKRLSFVFRGRGAAKDKDGTASQAAAQTGALAARTCGRSPFPAGAGTSRPSVRAPACNARAQLAAKPSRGKVRETASSAPRRSAGKVAQASGSRGRVAR